jgi:hypothetical protein
VVQKRDVSTVVFPAINKTDLLCIDVTGRRGFPVFLTDDRIILVYFNTNQKEFYIVSATVALNTLSFLFYVNLRTSTRTVFPGIFLRVQCFNFFQRKTNCGGGGTHFNSLLTGKENIYTNIQNLINL